MTVFAPNEQNTRYARRRTKLLKLDALMKAQEEEK